MPCAIPANSPITDNDLLEAAVAWLDARLPSAWEVERSQRSVSSGQDVAQTLDGVIDLKAPNGTYAPLAVEARASFAPRDVERLMPGLARSLRALAGHVPLLIVAPWLSARTQELLAAEEINFLDLTGNARIKLDNPPVFIESAGETRNPAPPARAPATLRGPRAGRLVRLLADIRPSYGVRELAAAAGLTAGYVSRLLDALDRDAILARSRRGAVSEVNVAALLRAWAESYDLFSTNAPTTYVAPNGAADALQRLAATSDTAIVTGSFAAVRLAAVAAPSMLVAYTRDNAQTAEALGLLPADEGANVALLRAFDEVVWARGTTSDGVTFAAASQVAVDCLTGNGRMPAEGEAVLEWMIEDEDRWRAPSLQASAASATSA